MMASAASKIEHEVDQRYLQGILVTFLAMSAALFLYTTLTDPVTEHERHHVPLSLPSEKRASRLLPPRLPEVRINGLDVIPLSDILVSAMDRKLVNEQDNMPVKMHPDPRSIKEDAKRKSFGTTSTVSHETAHTVPFPERMASDVVRRFAVRRSHDALAGLNVAQHGPYTLGDLYARQKRQTQLVDDLLAAAGCLLVAVFVCVVLIKVAIDGDLTETVASVGWRRRDSEAHLTSRSPAQQPLVSYGSFGSADVVSDWSGDIFDRFDV